MFTEYVDYHDTGYFSQTVLDYLVGAKALDEFYGKPPVLNSVESVLAQQKTKSTNRSVLVNVLKEQYQRIENSGGKVNDLVKENIRSLNSADSYTVTTGHQLNIFTGPLYTIYKILGTIALAKKLSSAHPDIRVMPVFWMATEDHDFAEINHLNVGDKPITWNQDQGGAVGRLDIKSIQPALGHVLSSLGLNPYLHDLEQMCRDAYLKNTNLADATRYLYNELFGSYGLIILDADNASLKNEFASIIEQDIFQQHSNILVSASNKKLESLGYHVQVHPREINFFYLQKNSRERIIREGEGFKVLNTTLRYSSDELRTEIRQFPERFSPNVIMRPIYQEVILPNLAYIGGGAEVSYWLSLKTTFLKYQIPFPILLLRNSALLVDEISRKRTDQLGFQTIDLFKDPRELVKLYVLRSSTKELDLNKELTALKEILGAIESKAFAVDSTLGESTRAIYARTRNMIEALEGKMLKAEKDKFDTEMSQIFKINQKLFPNHTLQERVENFLPYYARYGHTLFETLLESFDPFGKQMTVINL